MNDTDVRLTAQIAEDDDHDKIIIELRNTAHAHVQNQCDLWEAKLHDHKRRYDMDDDEFDIDNFDENDDDDL